MKKLFISVLITVIILFSCVFTAPSNSSNNSTPSPYFSTNGTYAISLDYTTLVDTSRSWDDNGTLISTREIPIKVYAPDLTYTGPFPILFMSYGLGGNVDSTSYIAEYLAAYGYIVVVVQHHRSDSKYLNDHGSAALTIAASQPQTRIMRPQDIIFVLNSVSSGNTGLTLLNPGRINISLVGVLGHSFGAWTTLACLGQTFDGGVNASDTRFLCGVAYSPQGSGTLGLDSASWNNIFKPTFTFGGTEDTSIGTVDPNDRRIPFDSMPQALTKYHGILNGATHSDFEDNGNHGDFYHSWIEQMTIAFFDTYLRNEVYAGNWLENKSIEKITDYVIQENK